MYSYMLYARYKAVICPACACMRACGGTATFCGLCSNCQWPVVGEMDVMETVNGHLADPGVYQVCTHHST